MAAALAAGASAVLNPRPRLRRVAPSTVTIIPSRSRTVPSPVSPTGEKVCLRRKTAWLT